MSNYFLDMYKSALGIGAKPLESQSSGKRITYIDLAKGVGIFLVVFVHADDWFNLDYQGRYAISIFLQALFFFMSGMFFKTYSGFKEFLTRKVNTLLIPFIAFYLLTACLLPNVLHQFGYEVRNEHMIGWQSLWAFAYPAHTTFSNTPLWFLLCLFVVSIAFYGIYSLVDFVCVKCRWNKSPIAKPAMLLIICAAAGVLGYYLAVHHINWYLFTDSACTVLPFFCVGYVLKNHTTILQKIDRSWWLWLLAAACLLYIYFFAPGVSYRLNRTNGSFGMLYSCAFVGICAVILLCRLCPAIPIVNFWGKHSLIILCTSNLVIQFTALFVRRLPFGDWTLFVLLIVIVMLVETLAIPFLVRFFPHITGQKNVLPVSGK